MLQFVRPVNKIGKGDLAGRYADIAEPKVLTCRLR